ncbi:MAG: matrixin family metalloprotease [Holophagales bacterium]|nr:MAG: matrixin family metalloprotease [Holophagales bacterium]
MPRISCLARLAAALAPLLVAGAASATSFVAVSDADLTAQADLIAVVRVEERLAPEGEGRPMTRYRVVVERLLKGDDPSAALTVEVPGGVRKDGVGQRIWGAPSFADGESALLFLRRGNSGAYHVLHLLQGAFHRMEIDERPVAFRDAREASELSLGDREASRDFKRVRDFDRFADWVADRAAGIARRPQYFVAVEPQQVETLVERFTLFEENGLNLRWFQFDVGGSVTYLAYQDGQQGLTGGGFAEFQQALRDWNNETSTPINLVYGGTTALTGGLDTYDGVNTILFNDPSAEIEDTFSCTGGGTLAFGGPWYSTSTTGQFGGRTFIRIQGGDIVTNDGISCFFERSGNASKAAEELFAHEMGHNLGLGHASESKTETDSTLKQALMYAYIHNDGRGGQLNSDDILALRALYTVGGGVPTCGAGGSVLCLLNRRFQVSVSWQNQFNGRSGVGGAVTNTDLSGFFYFDDPSNIELIVKVLDFGTEIKVFYGQLTNLNFQLKVTDTVTGRTKTYTNTTGDCGAIDPDFSKAAALTAPAGLSEDRSLLERAGSCSDSPTTLCLLDGRFRLTVDWRNQFNSTSGTGGARRLSTLTGAFSFTDPANLEILVKTLDFGDKFLVLYGSLSNIEYTLRVTDTVRGVSRNYLNPAGNYCGGIDTTSFPK